MMPNSIIVDHPPSCNVIYAERSISCISTNANSQSSSLWKECHTCHLHVANGGSRGLPWSSILGTLFEAKTSKKNPLNIIKTKKKIVNTRLKSVLTVRSHISRHTSWNHISRISITPCKKTRVVFLFFVHLMFRGNSLLVWSSHPIHIFNSHRP